MRRTGGQNKLKKKLKLLTAVVAAALALAACGEDPVLSRFRDEMDNFCTRISEIDSSINNIDAQDLIFQDFAELDFPEEFDYLEELADEAGQYMTEAVKSYHEAYSNGSYNEYTAEYARQNYSRAYKRVQIIITFLHGEEPSDADLTAE